MTGALIAGGFVLAALAGLVLRHRHREAWRHLEERAEDQRQMAATLRRQHPDEAAFHEWADMQLRWSERLLALPRWRFPSSRSLAELAAMEETAFEAQSIAAVEKRGDPEALELVHRLTELKHRLRS